MKKNSKRSRFNFEIPIVILIAGMLIILINVGNDKLDQINLADIELLFMDIGDDPTGEMHKDLAEHIQQFRPNVCRMIEVYDETFNMVIRLGFDEEATEESYNSILDHPKFINFLTNNERGHTSIEIDDHIEYVYFRWQETTDGDRLLFMIYTYKPIVRNLWLLDFIAYNILILVCVLFMIISLRRRNESIRRLNELSR